MMKKTGGRGPRLIGLTGTYCAGKNHIAGVLEVRGLPVLDVDTLGHEAVEAGREAIIARFGGDVLGAGGKINRRLLGEKVFGKPEELAALEAIVHPEANRLTEEWITRQTGPACVINAALLHKASVFNRLDFIILVRAPFLIRLFRARRRDRLPWFSLLKRLESQKQFTPQYFKGNADIYKVDNRGYFFLGSRFFRRNLETRIDNILSGEGIR
ncbi:MAG: dephospho-CoA kinase [Treponema sp.]|jgi:dephospho-CoA kinase|nr:dephospho-CoA kinase [Treponema sp.]